MGDATDPRLKLKPDRQIWRGWVWVPPVESGGACHVDGHRQKPEPGRSASVKERGLSSASRACGVERWASLEFEELVDRVPHQGVLLRDGSVARHLSASRGVHGAVGPRPKDSIR